jgi:transcriptional regulator with XRE-family HTH domain
MVSRARRRALATLLLNARNRAGLTQEDLAERSTVSRSAISRIERSEMLPSDEQLTQLLVGLRISGDDAASAHTLREDAVTQDNWLEVGGRRLPQQLATLADYEADATGITYLALVGIPGLLQTREYTRAVMALDDITAAQLDRLLTARLARQEAALRRRMRIEAFLDAPILGRPTGGVAVAAGQLAHLLDLGRRDHITIRVIPHEDSSAAALAAPFLILDLDGEPQVAYAEHPLGGSFVDQRDAVLRLARNVDRLRESALSPDESSELIQATQEEIT